MNNELLSLANQVLPTLPTTLFNILPIDCGLGDMIRMLSREYIHYDPDHSLRMFPYIYLTHAYEVTNNPALKPLIDYIKPNRKSIDTMMFHVNNAKKANYFPTEILEPHGFASLDELVQAIENALNGTGLHRLANIRAYINDADALSAAFLSTFTEEDYYESYDEMAADIYKRRSVYRPLLFYLDFVQKETILTNFKEMFYALKYKQQFRHLLWEKVREPKIRAKYHPDNLAKMLEALQIGELDVDQLDALMDQW